MKRNNNVVVILLVSFIVILIIVLCGLFATNTLQLNVNKNKSHNDGGKDNLVANGSIKSDKLSRGEAMMLGKDLYDKATEIYSTWVLLPYCGYSHDEIFTLSSVVLSSTVAGARYYKSEFNNMDELKKYLAKFLSKK